MALLCEVLGMHLKVVCSTFAGFGSPPTTASLSMSSATFRLPIENENAPPTIISSHHVSRPTMLLSADLLQPRLNANALNCPISFSSDPLDPVDPRLQLALVEGGLVRLVAASRG